MIYTPQGSLTIAQMAVTMMQKHFAFDIKNRLVVLADAAIYRVNEDKSLFDDTKKNKYGYEVYFDGEYVCGFDSTESPVVVELRMLKNIVDLKKTGKIHWNTFLYEEEKKKLEDEAKKKKIEEKDALDKKMKAATTSEEKLVNMAIQKTLKKSKKKL